VYKTKPCADCAMPAPGTALSALVLNASLKHAPGVSNTQEVAEPVVGHMGPHGVKSESVRLADLAIPLGLGFRQGDPDDWPAIVGKIRAADIVIFARRRSGGAAGRR
jgi:multimeric flavodoxin WrbA